MNKKLEIMKTDIQKRIQKYTAFVAVMLILLCLAVSGVVPVKLASEAGNDFVSGFQIGLFVTLLTACAAKLLKYRRALKDEKQLKQLYYQEKDERVCYINQQVGASSMWITTAGMVIATIIAGYVHIIAFCTMLGVTALQGLIQIGLKWYYTKRSSENNMEE